MHLFSRATVALAIAHVAAIGVFASLGEHIELRVTLSALGMLLVGDVLLFIYEYQLRSSLLHATGRVLRALLLAIATSSVLGLLVFLFFPSQYEAGVRGLSAALHLNPTEAHIRLGHFLAAGCALWAVVLQLQVWTANQMAVLQADLIVKARLDSFHKEIDGILSSASGANREEIGGRRRSAFDTQMNAILGDTMQAARFSLADALVAPLEYLKLVPTAKLSAWVVIAHPVEDSRETQGEDAEFENIGRLEITHVTSSHGKSLGEYRQLVGKDIARYDPSVNQELVDRFQTEPSIKGPRSEFLLLLSARKDGTRRAELEAIILRRLQSLLERPEHRKGASEILEGRTSVTGLVFCTGKPLVVRDLDKFPYADHTFRSKMPNECRYNSAAAAPIIVHGRKRGVLVVLSTRFRDFPERNLGSVQLSANAIGHLLDFGIVMGIVGGSKTCKFRQS